MGGALSTFSRFNNLLRTTSLTPTKFSALCRLYEIQGLSDASLNRAIQRKDFNHEVDVAVEPLVSRIEDLIKRARPFPVSFDDVEVTKMVLDFIGFGFDVRVGEPISVNSSDVVNECSQI
jgi:hypothetical protein